MKILVLAQILFGFFVFVRILGELQSKKLLSRRLRSVVIFIFFLFQTIFALLLSGNLLFFFGFTTLQLTFVAVLPLLIRYVLRQKFIKYRIRIVNLLILRMRLGHALRPSFSLIIQQSSEPFREKLCQIFDEISLSKTDTLTVCHDYEVAELIEVFKNCEKEPHTAIKRMTLYRHKLDVENRFRLKLSASLSAIRAQTGVLTVLYLGALFFILQKYSFQSYAGMIFLSVLLFALGLGLQIFIGKKIQWTV